jgi:hypothetical protein
MGRQVRVPAGYQAMRVYIVSCVACNEEISRAATGEDVRTEDEVRLLIKDHQEIFHPENDGAVGR